MKKCSKCLSFKKYSEFYKNRTTRDGLGSYCRECASEVWRGWAQENRESLRRRERVRDRKRYYANRVLKRPKRLVTKSEASCTKCKEIKGLDAFSRQRSGDGWKPHPWCRECRKPLIRARKAKLHGACGSHTAQDVRALWAKQRGRCALCGVKLLRSRFHVDHITALARGGSNSPENLQLTHGRCNMVKGAKDPIAHAQSLGKLL
jgi:5-methylcytosine-specific restriction endonuclease McrA